VNVVLASAFRHQPPEVKKVIEAYWGNWIVNDCFIPWIENNSKVTLFYGSYGSGKSVFIVDLFLNKCLDDKYFRGYFGRKVLDTVRNTVHKTFTDRIKERKLEKFFVYSDKPNGSMRILCKKNGNELIPFGASDAASLKSIKDPTHFFCEEFDQFTFEDFGFIFSRLRTEKAATQFYGAFNTEKIYQSHWIRKIFFDGGYTGQVATLKANYTGNYFINQEEYYKSLQLIANGNAAVLNAIANGEWGAIRTGGEFWKCFDESKHVKPLKPRKDTTIHVSLDENVNPYVTQIVWQISVAEKRLSQVHEILSRSPANNAPKAAKQFADWLHSIGYSDTVFVYGDPSAGKRSTIDANNASFFDKYISTLKDLGFSVVSRVQRSAPEVSLSADFINAIYENNHEGWSIEVSDMCFGSIEDYIIVKEDAEGRMLKAKEKDKETGVTFEPHGHCSDAKRYFITTVLEKEFVAFKGRRRKTGSIAVPRLN
jgi:PBSX family phage terminase large subunit